MKHSTLFTRAKRQRTKKQTLLNGPTPLSSIAFNNWDEEPLTWQERAQRLQARRWRKLKHQLV